VTLWAFLDRAAGAIGSVRAASPALPGPLGLAAYARMRRSGADLPPRTRLLVGQLAAERSGCGWCAQRNRHLALQAGVSAVDADGVTRYVTQSGYSEPERAALALADAITQFCEADNGFPPEVLCQARRLFGEPEIMALVGVVTAEHFFDARTGRMGRDAGEKAVEGGTGG
jgi:alkylhydroperoxidase family enzyme